jgi:hypothetical protein
VRTLDNVKGALIGIAAMKLKELVGLRRSSSAVRDPGQRPRPLPCNPAVNDRLMWRHNLLKARSPAPVR